MRKHTVTVNVHLIEGTVLRVRIRDGGSWWYRPEHEEAHPAQLIITPQRDTELHERLEIPMHMVLYVEVVIRNPPLEEGCELHAV